MKEYNPHEIEPRWQKVWAETGAHKATEETIAARMEEKNAEETSVQP